MKKLLLFLILVSLPLSGYAEDIYIAQNPVGNDTGTNSSNAHSIQWLNNSANWGEGQYIVGPGDTVHLYGTISSSLKVQGSGNSSNPITILFESGAKLSRPAWGVDSEAAIFSSNKDFIVIDGGTNGKIECTNNGTGLGVQQKATGIHIDRSDHWEIKNLTITNIYQRTPNSSDSNRYGRGIQVNTCSYLSVHDLTVDNAEYGFYAFAQYASTNDLDLYKSNISKCATGIVLALSGAVNYSDLKVHDNQIHDLYYWDGEWNVGTSWHHSDGIHTWGNYPNNTLGPLKIYDNEFFGDWGAHVSGWIYTTDYTTPVEVYNNSFINSAEKPALGFIVLRSYTNVATAYLHDNTMTGRGINNTGGIGVYLRQVNAKVERNIFKDLYTGVLSEAGDVELLSDYNTFIKVSNIGYDTAVGFIPTLPNWQEYLGGCPAIYNDCNSTAESIRGEPLIPPAPSGLMILPG